MGYSNILKQHVRWKMMSQISLKKKFYNQKYIQRRNREISKSVRVTVWLIPTPLGKGLANSKIITTAEVLPKERSKCQIGLPSLVSYTRKMISQNVWL